MRTSLVEYGEYPVVFILVEYPNSYRKIPVENHCLQAEI